MKLDNNRYSIGWLGDDVLVLSAGDPVDVKVLKEFDLLLSKLIDPLEP
jgi:hypothetical protein